MKNKPRYSVSRAGMGGRPAGEHPSRPLMIACTPDEYQIILRASPRMRAELILREAVNIPADIERASAVIVGSDGVSVVLAPVVKSSLVDELKDYGKIN